MAITQQLARMTKESRIECSLSASSLYSLITYDTHFAAEYLDLDWTPAHLRDSFLEAGYQEVSDAVNWATDGKEILNPLYPNGPPNYHLFSMAEIRYLPYVEVRKISERFLPLKDYRFPTYGKHFESLEKRGVREPNQYLDEYWKLLVDFYSAAEKEGDDIVVWWD